MWPNPQFPADLVAFTEEILNRKLHLLCIGISRFEAELFYVFHTIFTEIKL